MAQDVFKILKDLELKAVGLDDRRPERRRPHLFIPWP
jgi:hypothetical protein